MLLTLRCMRVCDRREGELKTWVSHIFLPPDRTSWAVRVPLCALRQAGHRDHGRADCRRAAAPRAPQNLRRVMSLHIESPGSLTQAASSTSIFSLALWRGSHRRRVDKPGPHTLPLCGFERPHVYAASGTGDGFRGLASVLMGLRALQ